MFLRVVHPTKVRKPTGPAYYDKRHVTSGAFDTAVEVRMKER
jgi:hypothetical protein